MIARAHSGSAWICQGSTAATGSARRRERRHREPEADELLPVELGPLALTGPDDRLARLVDAVGHLDPAVKRDARNRAGQGERDPVEGVVVVVLHDDEPRPAGSGARPRLARLLLADGRGDRRHAFECTDP